jgi:hypothetical protein
MNDSFFDAVLHLWPIALFLPAILVLLAALAFIARLVDRRATPIAAPRNNGLADHMADATAVAATPPVAAADLWASKSGNSC